jgi:hypothetical protein
MKQSAYLPTHNHLPQIDKRRANFSVPSIDSARLFPRRLVPIRLSAAID